MAVTIRQHAPGSNSEPFVQLPFQLFANDPAWIAPLLAESRDRLNPKKNPFFQHGEAAFFTAWIDDRIVGRCSAQVDHEHLRVHNDGVGFFGLLDTIDDQDVCTSLLNAAEEWLKTRGIKNMRGPMSLSMNDECGTLVEGFDHPPAILMPHSLPHQGRLIEGAGLSRVKDLLAWRAPVQEPPARAQKAWEYISSLPEVKFRSANKRRLPDEIAIVHEILNDAWADNWGFVPMTRAELDKLGRELKLIIDPELAFFVEIDGRPMAMCICLPNLNEVIEDFKGRLSPLNMAKLLWRMKFRQPKSARLIVLGIRKELRSSKRYAALSVAMYAEISKRGLRRGYQWAEYGWTLEDNRPINSGIRRMGGEIYKRYRIYEKEI